MQQYRTPVMLCDLKERKSSFKKSSFFLFFSVEDVDLEWGCTSSSKLVNRKLTRFSHKRAYFVDENSTFVALFKKNCSFFTSDHIT